MSIKMQEIKYIQTNGKQKGQNEVENFSGPTPSYFFSNYSQKIIMFESISVYDFQLIG